MIHSQLRLVSTDIPPLYRLSHTAELYLSIG